MDERTGPIPGHLSAAHARALRDSPDIQPPFPCLDSLAAEFGVSVDVMRVVSRLYADLLGEIERLRVPRCDCKCEACHLGLALRAASPGVDGP